MSTPLNQVDIITTFIMSEDYLLDNLELNHYINWCNKVNEMFIQISVVQSNSRYKKS